MEKITSAAVSRCQSALRAHGFEIDAEVLSSYLLCAQPRLDAVEDALPHGARTTAGASITSAITGSLPMSIDTKCHAAPYLYGMDAVARLRLDYLLTLVEVPVGTPPSEPNDGCETWTPTEDMAVAIDFGVTTAIAFARFDVRNDPPYGVAVASQKSHVLGLVPEDTSAVSPTALASRAISFVKEVVYKGGKTDFKRASLSSLVAELIVYRLAYCGMFGVPFVRMHNVQRELEVRAVRALDKLNPATLAVYQQQEADLVAEGQTLRASATRVDEVWRKAVTEDTLRVMSAPEEVEYRALASAACEGGISDAFTDRVLEIVAEYKAENAAITDDAKRRDGSFETTVDGRVVSLCPTDVTPVSPVAAVAPDPLVEATPPAVAPAAPTDFRAAVQAMLDALRVAPFETVGDRARHTASEMCDITPLGVAAADLSGLDIDRCAVRFDASIGIVQLSNNENVYSLDHIKVKAVVMYGASVLCTAFEWGFGYDRDPDRATSPASVGLKLPAPWASKKPWLPAKHLGSLPVMMLSILDDVEALVLTELAKGHMESMVAMFISAAAERRGKMARSDALTSAVTALGGKVLSEVTVSGYFGRYMIADRKLADKAIVTVRDEMRRHSVADDAYRVVVSGHVMVVAW